MNSYLKSIGYYIPYLATPVTFILVACQSKFEDPAPKSRLIPNVTLPPPAKGSSQEVLGLVICVALVPVISREYSSSPENLHHQESSHHYL